MIKDMAKTEKGHDNAVNVMISTAKISPIKHQF